MKTRIFLLSLAALSLAAFTSCSDDDNKGTENEIPEAYTEALTAKYPDATNVKWEIKGNYYVAEFDKPMQEYDVWFGSGATWAMTEVDYGHNLFFIPGTVSQAYAESEYGMGNTVADVHKYERTADTVYLIEVELASDNSDVYMYINEDGTIVKTTTTEIDVTPDTQF